MTQEELAELTKVNLRTIQRIENNENTPRAQTLKLILDVLDMDAAELESSDRSIPRIMLHVLVMIGINFLIMSLYGFLILDVEANFNSRFGAFVLSMALPYITVELSPKLSSRNRLFQFGIGMIVYMIAILFMHGFPLLYNSGFFLITFSYLTFLYFFGRMKTAE